MVAEFDFVRETLGANEGDIVVIKTGPMEGGEKFFDDLSDVLEVSENKNFSHDTK